MLAILSRGRWVNLWRLICCPWLVWRPNPANPYSLPPRKHVMEWKPYRTTVCKPLRWGIPDMRRPTTQAISLHWRHKKYVGVSNHQPHDCLLNCLFRRKSKKRSKFRVIGLCAGNTTVTGEFPAPRASNAENVSIWWRHHVLSMSSSHSVNILSEKRRLKINQPQELYVKDGSFKFSWVWTICLLRKWRMWSGGGLVNTSKPRWNDRHFPDNLFKCISGIKMYPPLMRGIHPLVDSLYKRPVMVSVDVIFVVSVHSFSRRHFHASITKIFPSNFEECSRESCFTTSKIVTQVAFLQITGHCIMICAHKATFVSLNLKLMIKIILKKLKWRRVNFMFVWYIQISCISMTKLDGIKEVLTMATWQYVLAISDCDIFHLECQCTLRKQPQASKHLTVKMTTLRLLSQWTLKRTTLIMGVRSLLGMTYIYVYQEQ